MREEGGLVGCFGKRAVLISNRRWTEICASLGGVAQELRGNVPKASKKHLHLPPVPNDDVATRTERSAGTIVLDNSCRRYCDRVGLTDAKDSAMLTFSLCLARVTVVPWKGI